MANRQQIEVRYEEASLTNVMQFFADNYKAPAGLRFLRSFDGSNRIEYFVDTVQGKVIYKLYLEQEQA